MGAFSLIVVINLLNRFTMAVDMVELAENDEAPNWGKKGAASTNDEARTAQMVKMTQQLFANSSQSEQNWEKRSSKTNEIQNFLEGCSPNSTSACAPVASNYLKNFVKFFEQASGEFLGLKKYRSEVGILKLIVIKFPSFVPSHREILIKILLQELSFTCELNCERYQNYIIHLLAQIAVAGKWSVQNETFRPHYESVFSAVLSSVYFLAYKYEFYQKSEIYSQSITAAASEKSDNLIVSKEELLQMSEAKPQKFVSVLMSLLKALVTEKIVQVGSFPIKLAMGFSCKVLDSSEVSGEAKNISLFLLHLKLEVIDFLKLLCLRFNSSSVVFIRPVIDIVSDLLKRAASYMVSQFTDQNVCREMMILFASLFDLAECIVGKVSTYAFEKEVLGNVLVSLTFVVRRYATEEFKINDAVLADDLNFTNKLLIGGSKKSRKRKREQMSKLTAAASDKNGSNNELYKARCVDLISTALSLSACLFRKCSQQFTAEILHKSMSNMISLSLTVFSGSKIEFQTSTVRFRNMEYFKCEKVLMALLAGLEALVSNPNPKCSPPLAIISEVVKMAPNDERDSVASKAKDICKMIEMIIKPNSIAVLPTINLKYEPKTETEHQIVQTENQVTLVNVSAQTVQFDTDTSLGKQQPKVDKKTRNSFVQTEKKWVEIEPRQELKLSSEKQVDRPNDLHLNNEDEDNFLDICEEFVPDIN